MHKRVFTWVIFYIRITLDLTTVYQITNDNDDAFVFLF